VTLLVALQTGGGGTNAFWRQAVAQLLTDKAYMNAGGGGQFSDPVAWMVGLVNTIYPGGGTYLGQGPLTLEQWKDLLESSNNL
jgi:hypothetical protein